MILFTSYTGSDIEQTNYLKNQIGGLQSEIQCLQEDNSSLTYAICNLENENNIHTSSLRSTDYLIEALYSTKRGQRELFKEIKEKYTLPGTKFKLVKGLGYKVFITKDFYKALAAYNGPEVFVTSIYRGSNPRSAHAAGRAIDVRLKDKSGKELVEWLRTPEGINWVESNGLNVKIEDNKWTSLLTSYRSIFRPMGLGKYIFMNSDATAAHIHIAIKPHFKKNKFKKI